MNIRLLSGDPTPEELAAVLTVLHALARHRAADLPADVIHPAPWSRTGHRLRPGTRRPAGWATR
ncbi:MULTISPECIES: acyl-CoA carboxylase subunit epsilon [unclassified Streptomyces]|uniref:acyl-CoA carboxylase subunit epsilon n=1 Tax=unclassified Streptomyces TaxID=2593676 RepID=UPI000DAE6F87|nr:MULTISPECIES: acyl-CoA carboxylase subunit epsilon [unclassified Streptomyces]PZT72570.1 acyl-CoA carboxylase subunit epsilon [Streptomyces sp. AC1-42T]PZT81112.1 acyl-CoA carboxylase subunit epsilon [Streptomyces sp. AC1-42W]